ncbi:MAG: AEC family transporter [Clostridia bacterium]|nr:AEC family transporter [Clostridia bacterium]
MLEAFITTLDPMLMLFSCIAIGYIIKKLGVLPDNSATVLAKLETNVIFPALSFVTMGRNCTPDTISTHIVNIVLATVVMLIAITIAVGLAPLFAKEKGMERGVYKYALAFANSGYVGDPLVLGMFGDAMLSYYKLYTFPLTIGIYTWGLNSLIPKSAGKKNMWKDLLNPSIVGLVLGVIAGLTGAFNILPGFAVNTLDALKSCMGPLAMILAGFTVASYPFKEMITDKKVYIATVLRLIILPAVLIAALFGIKELANIALGLNIGNTVLFLCFFAVAAPLGLNTVVFPAAYDGNPKTGAGMAMISHTICVITIPLMYALMTELFGAPMI